MRSAVSVHVVWASALCVLEWEPEKLASRVPSLAEEGMSGVVGDLLDLADAIT